MGKGFIRTKLKRYFGFTESMNGMLLVEGILKIGIHPSCQPCGVAFLKISGKPSNSEYLLVLNLFNAFLKNASTKRALLDFRIPRLRKPANSLVRVFEVFGRVSLNNFRLLNFMYMLLVMYIPRVLGASGHSVSFTTSAVFPDFSAYPKELNNYTRLYPQYGALLKKTGFSRFLRPFNLLTIVPFSSYMLKHLYISSIFEYDWTARVEFYWLSNKARSAAHTSLFYSFFKLCNF